MGRPHELGGGVQQIRIRRRDHQGIDLTAVPGQTVEPGGSGELIQMPDGKGQVFSHVRIFDGFSTPVILFNGDACPQATDVIGRKRIDGFDGAGYRGHRIPGIILIIQNQFLTFFDNISFFDQCRPGAVDGFRYQQGQKTGQIHFHGRLRIGFQQVTGQPGFVGQRKESSFNHELRPSFQ